MLDTRHPEVKLALTIVREGAAVALRVQERLAARDLTKSDCSPVTVADFASQALAARTLQAHSPDTPLVGEESAAALRSPDASEVRRLVAEFAAEVAPGATEEAVCDWIDRGLGDPGSRFWTLDPIDGTKGYLRGGQYAVALALVEEGQVVLGALACPHLGEGCAPADGGGAVLIARRGEGAWLSVGGASDFAALRVSACREMRRARVMRSAEDSHTNAGAIDALGARLGIEAEPVRMDSQAKYGVLAAGGGELLFRLLNPGREDYKECIWDQAAGSIILEEAGGRITDLKGRPLDFTQGRKLAANTGVFASNGPLHEAGLEAIAQVCKLP